MCSYLAHTVHICLGLGHNSTCLKSTIFTQSIDVSKFSANNKASKIRNRILVMCLFCENSTIEQLVDAKLNQHL